MSDGMEEMDFEHRKPRAIGPTPHSAPEKKESSLLEQIEFKQQKIENQQKKEDLF